MAAFRCAAQMGRRRRRPAPEPSTHVGEAPHPDEAVRVVEIPELAGQANADLLLALDELTLEELDQLVPPSRMEGVLAEFEQGTAARMRSDIGVGRGGILRPHICHLVA